MKRKPLALAGALVAVALVFALSTGVAGAAKGGNSANAKKCQGTGYQNWVRDASGGGTPFGSADECTAYAARGGTLVAKPVTHQLTVRVVLSFAGVDPDTAGRVTSDPAGIDCVADALQTVSVCHFDFTEGTIVNLTAQPSGGVGTVFDFWATNDASCLEDNPCAVTMNSDAFVTALFVGT